MTISVFISITLTLTESDLLLTRKSFSVIFFNFIVFVIHFGMVCFFIFETILPLDTTNRPPMKTLLGFSLFRSSKTKISASLPGAIPPKSLPML